MASKWDKYAATEAPAAPELPTEETPKDGARETAQDTVVGVGTGLSLDFDDEIAGAFRAMGEWSFQLGAGQGLEAANRAGKAGYTETRDKYRARKHLAEERSPYANFAGQVGGGVLAGIATGGAGAGAGAARAAGGSAIKAGLKSAGRMALEGGIQAAGASEAETAGEIAKDAATGAVVAPVVGGATKYGVRRLGQALQPGKTAQRLEARAARHRMAQGGLNPRQVAKAPGGIEAQLARQQEMGIGGGLKGKETILEESAAAVEKQDAARKVIGQQLAGKGVKVDGRAVGLRLRQAAAQISPGPAGADRRAAYLSMAEDYEKMGVQPFSVFDQERSELAGRVFASDSPKNLIQQDVHLALNEVLEDVANQADPGQGSKFRKAGQLMAAGIRAKEGAEAGLNREAGNRVVGMGDQAMGLIGAFQGGPIGAVAGVLGNKLLRGKEHALVASADEAVARGLRKTGKVGKYTSPIGRALEMASSPLGGAVGRTAAAASATKVAQAGQEGPEAMAQAHFEEAMDNPEYRQEVVNPYE